MNYLRLILIGLLLLVLGVAIGYYEAPTKTINETKVDVSQDKSVETDTTTTKKFDPNTGKVVEESTTVAKKNDVKNETDTDHIKITQKSQPNWSIKVGGAKNLTDLSKPYARVGVEKRVLGPIWFGVEADINTSPVVGGYLRLEF